MVRRLTMIRRITSPPEVIAVIEVTGPMLFEGSHRDHTQNEGATGPLRCIRPSDVGGV
jgi:hypothetical protein